MPEEEHLEPSNESPLEHLTRFLKAYDSGEFSNVPVLGRKCDHVILGGMGRSGVVGSIIVDFAKDVVDVPVDIVRTNRLPAHISENTLALVISYSGNTREMLELYSECVSRGCRLIVLTTGGKLEKMAEDDGKQLIRIRGGFTPCSDIAFAIGYVASIIDQNCGTALLDTFSRTVRSSLPYAKSLSNPNDVDNLAWKIALEFSGRTPFIYSNDDIGCVVNRWKCQMNETAEIPAACGTFPGVFHHGVQEAYRRNLMFFFLRQAFFFLSL